MFWESYQKQTKISRHICSFHQQHPSEQYAGCTCSTTITFKSNLVDVCKDCDPVNNPKCDRCIGS